MSQAGKFFTSGGGGSGIQTVTGNTGGPVSPDGFGNINILGTNVISIDGNAGTFTEVVSLTNGTDGQVLIGGGVQPTWNNITSTGGTITITNGANSINLESVGGNVIITKFTANGTWNKNANAKTVEIYLWNGGCGGGSGRQATSTTSGGGGGGQTGGVIVFQGLAATFNNSETVTIGSGGGGGGTQAGANSNGNPGSVGGFSAVGNISFTVAALAGRGGIAGTAAGGTAVTSSFITSFDTINVTVGDGGNGQIAAAANATDLGDAPLERLTASGGGGGSGADTVIIRSAGNGGDIARFGNGVEVIFISGGTAGIESGTIDGGDGNPFISTTGGYLSGGTGGGGGGGQSAGVVAGNGGNGGIPAGGGGGGGGSLNGTTSGAGGNGARGEVWVIEYT